MVTGLLVTYTPLLSITTVMPKGEGYVVNFNISVMYITQISCIRVSPKLSSILI